MPTLPLNALKSVKEALSLRRKDLNEAAQAISLLKGAPDFLVAQFTDYIKSLIPVDNIIGELKAAESEAVNIMNSVYQEIPKNVAGNDALEQSLHSQFKIMSQQLLLGKGARANVAALMKNCANDLLSNVSGFDSQVKGIVSEAQSFGEDLKEIISTKKFDPQATFLAVSQKIPGMLQKVNTVKDKVAQLQGRIATGKDFARSRTDGIVSMLQDLKNDIPELSSISTLMSPEMQQVISDARGIPDTFDRIKEQAFNLANFKDNIVSSIRPGDLFKSNFTQIFSQLKSMGNILSTVNTVGDLNPKSLAAISGLVSKANSISGLVKVLGNKQFVTDLKDTGNALVQQMDSLKDNLLGQLNVGGLFDQVKGHIGTLTRDVKALGKLAERTAKGRPPTEAVMNALLSRIPSMGSLISNGLNTLTNIVNVFEPEATTDVKAFMDSIGTVAPAAGDAILRGNITNFEKTLYNPQFLTKFGIALGELQNVVNSMALTVDAAAKTSTVMSFLAGQHLRQVMGMALGNLPSRRSAALKSMDLFVKSYIEPIEKIVTSLEK